MSWPPQILRLASIVTTASLLFVTRLAKSHRTTYSWAFVPPKTDPVNRSSGAYTHTSHNLQTSLYDQHIVTVYRHRCLQARRLHRLFYKIQPYRLGSHCISHTSHTRARNFTSSPFHTSPLYCSQFIRYTVHQTSLQNFILHRRISTFSMDTTTLPRRHRF